MDAAALPLTSLLRQARKVTRVSQLELSLRLNVSQRHVSFVESGRSKPGRELLLAWLEELNAPLALRNTALLQAGYAPAYRSARLSDPELAQASAAIDHLLRAHDPMPALVLDAEWNLVNANRGGQWLAAQLLPGAEMPTNPASPNMLDMLTAPGGILSRIINLAEVGPPLLAQLRAEVAAFTGLSSRVEVLESALRERLGAAAVARATPRLAAPVLTTRFATVAGELAFFSMLTTFGTPHDITLASLRVEHMFPADHQTRRVLEREVGEPATL